MPLFYNFRAYLAGVIEKSNEGIQECEQCLDRLGGFSYWYFVFFECSDFYGLLKTALLPRESLWKFYQVKLRFGGENIYLVDDELSLADLVLGKDLSYEYYN